MAQYLLALYKADGDDAHPEEVEQVWAGVNELGDKMTEAGAFVFKSGLLPAASATVVRQSGGEFMLTDGPYTETKEHLAGFWIINAADLDEALEWAKQAAVAEQRAIEVRPFFEGELDDAIAANTPETQKP